MYTFVFSYRTPTLSFLWFSLKAPFVCSFIQRGQHGGWIRIFDLAQIVFLVLFLHRKPFLMQASLGFVYCNAPNTRNMPFICFLVWKVSKAWYSRTRQMFILLDQPAFWHESLSVCLLQRLFNWSSVAPVLLSCLFIGFTYYCSLIFHY